jgi:hypothetical protein
MLLQTKRVGLFVASGFLAAGMLSREASAKPIMTPFGEAEDSCVHEIPMGGNLDTETGTVTVNGKVVDQHSKCTSGWQMNSRPTASKLPATGGWYAWTDAQNPSISGTNYPFDAAYTDLWVPTDPSPPAGDSPIIYLFSSLENNQALSNNGTGCNSSNTTAIIQPVLQWGQNGSLGGPHWYMAAYEVYWCDSDCSTNCSVGHSPFVQVSAGDALGGSMWQTAHGTTDTWEIRWDDANGLYTWNTMTVASWVPKFGSFQEGVLEAYNINSCADFSPDNSLKFWNFGVYVAYPSWNSYDEADVFGSNILSFSHNTASEPTNCSQNASLNSTEDSTITWVE